MLIRSLSGKGTSLASYMAQLSKDPIVTKDSIQLDAIVNEANKDEEVVYAAVGDATGALLTTRFASINSRSSGVKAVLAGIPKDSELPEVMKAIRAVGKTEAVQVPILVDGDTLGTVTLGMSTAIIGEQIRKTLLFIVVVNAVTALLLCSVLFLSVKGIIVKPINRLTAVSEAVAGGRCPPYRSLRRSGQLAPDTPTDN